jgi:deoxyribonuclease IV
MRIGAHVSISGSLDQAIDRAVAIGCECLQIFYGSPRQWRVITYSEEAISRFIAKRRAAMLDPLVAHAAYLVNLAAPFREYRKKSITSLLATMRGAERLDGLGAVTHLGSRMATPRSAALRRAALSIRSVLDRTERAMLLLENSVGAGGNLGADFDDLGAILDLLGGHPRIGFCIDTAHVFATGWDLRTIDGIDAMIEALDRAVGWQRVRLVHLNDSKGALGSRIDRHENIGEGWIGPDGFRALLSHPRLRGLPGIIETPGFDRTGPDRKNIARLKRLRGLRRTLPQRPRRTHLIPSHSGRQGGLS